MSCPKWLETAVFYEIYPQSFYDSNGDGIGDIQGIIRKLNYIKHLGCNAIWINPCFDSPFGDAGYDISDYYKIAPRYGSNEDMKQLFDEAHRLGINICLDLVPGHTSIEHPWFKESCKAAPNKYTNWYIWNDSPWNRGDGSKYYFVAGHAERQGSYMPNFFYFQPALNYGFAEPDPDQPWQLPVDHPDVLAVREELKRIIRFWLDMGADGFRVDMASSLVKNDTDSKATSALWQDIRCMFDSDYPEAVLISEWSSPSKAIPAGFHMDFMIHFNDDAYNSLFRAESTFFNAKPDETKHSFFQKNGQGDISIFLDSYLNHYGKTKDQGYISIVSGNHDISRIAYGRDKDELEVVFAFLLTMPGVPFIYYGDEIGMQHMEGLPSKEGGYERTGSRTPMQWSNDRNAGFSSADESRLYLPIDNSECAPNVQAQLGIDDSLLEIVRSFIQLRLDNPALGASGEFVPIYAEAGKYPFVYQRSCGESKMLIAVNPSGEPKQVTLDGSYRLGLIYGKGTTVMNSGDKSMLSMEGLSYGIYRLEG